MTHTQTTFENYTKTQAIYSDIFPQTFELHKGKRELEKMSASSLEEEFNEYDKNKIDKFLKNLL